MVIMLSEKEKKAILEKAKEWFEENVIAKHIENIKKRASGKDITINPYTLAYLGRDSSGQMTYTSVAGALLLPFAFGTSIATTFGTALQSFLVTVFPNVSVSVSMGMDIEFDDALTQRHVYCQVKAGPRTINAGDVPSILGHFQSLSNLARTNGLTLNPLTDYCVGVLYGEKEDLSYSYRKIAKDVNVYCGAEFFQHLTGDPDFYRKLISEFSKAQSGSKSLQQSIEEAIIDLSQTDLIRHFVDSLNKV